MFIGHYAPALLLAASHRAPRLGPLFLAAQLVDIAFFAFVLTGVEQMGVLPNITVMNPYDLWDMRWTHSLLGTLGWAAGFAVVVKYLTRSAAAAWIGAGVVASHWFLDLVVHAPDLTILGSGPRHGWRLWDHPYMAMPLELLLGFTAFAWYLNRTRATDWRGRGAPVLLGVVAVGFQLVNWLGPQPTEPALHVAPGVPITALAAYTILTVLAWWTGDLRERRRPAAKPGIAASPARS